MQAVTAPMPGSAWLDVIRSLPARSECAVVRRPHGMELSQETEALSLRGGLLLHTAFTLTPVLYWGYAPGYYQLFTGLLLCMHPIIAPVIAECKKPSLLIVTTWGQEAAMSR
jgi:hypothetical protein